jgi:Flp pilus assembly protein TadB
MKRIFTTQSKEGIYLGNLLGQNTTLSTSARVSFSPRIFARSFLIKNYKRLLNQLGIPVVAAAEKKALGLFIGFLVGIFMSIFLRSRLTFVQSSLIILISSFTGFSLYDFYLLDLKAFERFRQASELPGFLDLFYLEMASGVYSSPLDALAAISQQVDGVVSRKVKEVLAERNFFSQENLFKKLGQKLDEPEIHELVSLLQIHIRFGGNLIASLKDLSQRSHENRLSRSKILGQKSAAVLLLPLVVFFLPVTSMILLAPAVLSFLRQ